MKTKDWELVAALAVLIGFIGLIIKLVTAL
mgnify:FL=1|jgi:preprotein translocase subunit Sss1